MKPERDKPYVEIPIAVDTNTTTINTLKNKILWAGLMVIIYLAAEVGILLLASWLNKFLYSTIATVLLIYIIRYPILRERHYKKIRNRMIETNYTLPISEVWGILEISDDAPHIHRFTDGSKAIFISLAKGVKIGRPAGFQFENSEIIAEAYKEMDRAGITCMHMDYMDTTGKDKRLAGLFEQVEEVENEYLKRYLREKYSYTEELMNKTYTTHDVYAFFSKETDDKFWEDVQDVIEVFMYANYISAKALNRNETADLVKVVLNLKNFSVNQAVETIYKMANKQDRIKVIWSEKNGVREVHNKTKEELAEERATKTKKKWKAKPKKVKTVRGLNKQKEDTAVEETPTKSVEDDAEINLFD